MVDVLAFAAECRIPDSQQELLAACWPQLDSDSLSELENRDLPLHLSPAHPEPLSELEAAVSTGHVPGGYLEQQGAPVLEAVTHSEGQAGGAQPKDDGAEPSLSETVRASASAEVDGDAEGGHEEHTCGGLDTTQHAMLEVEVLPSLALSDSSPARIGPRQDEVITLKFAGQHTMSPVSMIASVQPETQSPGLMNASFDAALGQFSVSLEMDSPQVPVRTAAEEELAERAAWAECMIRHPPAEEEDEEGHQHQHQQHQQEQHLQEQHQQQEEEDGHHHHHHHHHQQQQQQEQQHQRSLPEKATADEDAEDQAADPQTGEQVEPQQLLQEKEKARGAGEAEAAETGNEKERQQQHQEEEQQKVQQGRVLQDLDADQEMEAIPVVEEEDGTRAERSQVPETQAVFDNEVPEEEAAQQQQQQQQQKKKKIDGSIPLPASEEEEEEEEGCGTASEDSDEIVELVVMADGSSSDEDDEGNGAQRAGSGLPHWVPCTQAVEAEGAKEEDRRPNRGSDDGGCTASTSSGEFEILPASPQTVSSSSQGPDESEEVKGADEEPGEILVEEQQGVEREEEEREGRSHRLRPPPLSPREDDTAAASRALRVRKRVRGPSQRVIGQKAARQEQEEKEQEGGQEQQQEDVAAASWLREDQPEAKRAAAWLSPLSRLSPALATVRHVFGWPGSRS